MHKLDPKSGARGTVRGRIGKQLKHDREKWCAPLGVQCSRSSLPLSEAFLKGALPLISE